MSASMPPEGDRTARPAQVTVAGIGLIVGGGAEVLVSAVAVAFAVYDSVRYHELHPLSLYPVVGVVAGVVAVVGGVHLLRGGTKVLAYAGAIASLVPGTLCCLIGAGFGVLALVILPRPGVRAHFGEPLPPPAPYLRPTTTPASPEPPYPGGPDDTS